MAQFKYTETQRLRRWDLMALLAGLMLVGVVSLIQVLMNGQPNKNLLLIMSLGVLILSGTMEQYPQQLYHSGDPAGQ